MAGCGGRAMTPAEIHQLPRRKGCPICGRPPSAAHAPFCSPRCRDIDLARWFGEAYAIPAVEDDQAEQGEGEGAGDRRDEN